MNPAVSNRIERSIFLNAPPARVWRALTDYREFGRWFGVNLEGPFLAGRPARGRITHPGYEHLVMEVEVVAIEPPALFAFAWHPYAVDPAIDYSGEPPTRVEFRLQPEAAGTRLTISESGFDSLPAARRDEAFRMNSGGWDAQAENIRAYLAGNA